VDAEDGVVVGRDPDLDVLDEDLLGPLLGEVVGVGGGVKRSSRSPAL